VRSTILLDGSFDPLHAGHVAYIQAARRAFPDDSLVVAVASDDDIRAKGREALLDQQTRADVVGQIKGVDSVFIKYQPTENVIAALRPLAYVKGKDWENRLPDEQVLACSEAGTQIVFLSGETRDSSTARLRQWALRDADASLDRLSRFIAHQEAAPAPVFDQEYFTGEWRGEQPFTYEARKKIEGRHPKLVKAVFDGLTVLDVGCGPGHFVRMLRELGMDAGGVDPSDAAVALSNGLADRVVRGDVASLPPKIAHVAICREVLEHVPVLSVGPLVAELFRVARKYVYITTRFSSDGVFDATTDFETDPTHITCLSQPFLRALCVLNGGVRRKGLEQELDHMGKGRVLVYEVTR